MKKSWFPDENNLHIVDVSYVKLLEGTRKMVQKLGQKGEHAWKMLKIYRKTWKLMWQPTPDLQILMHT